MVRIVTDSTADLTPELLQEFGVEDHVHIVPLTVHFGEEEFQDGVDLARDAFYEMLRRRAEMPAYVTTLARGVRRRVSRDFKSGRDDLIDPYFEQIERHTSVSGPRCSAVR